MSFRSLCLLLAATIGCTPSGMDVRSGAPVPAPAAPAWDEIAGGPRCAQYRDTVDRLRREFPALETHVTGAWLLCAISAHDDAATAAMLKLLGPATGYPDWDAAVAWAAWLLREGPLPERLPRAGRQQVIEQAIATAATLPLTETARVFMVWPEWDWPELLEREIRSMLPAPAALTAAQRLVDRGYRPRAWALLQHTWKRVGLTDENALAAPARWCDCAPETIAYWLARLAFDLREYALAAIAADTAAGLGTQPGPAILLRGRALARQHRGNAAVRYWKARLPGVPDADSRAAILYRLGLLAEDRGDLTEARRWYERAAAVPTPIRDRDHAGFRLGWLSWIHNDRAAAHRAWLNDLERAKDPVAVRRLLYWLGRADPEGGWHTRLYNDAPLSWYAWLALDRQEEWPHASVRWTDTTPATPPAGLSESLGPVRLARRLDWSWPARFEFEAALARAASPDLRLALLSEAAQVDLAATALRAFWKEFGDRFRADPPTFDLRLWRIVYPRPFSDAVAAAARRHAVDEALVYAVMREESHFQPEIISPAGAVGLLQLMPATATRLATAIGCPAPTLRDLFSPELNLDLGAAYLRQLLDRFAGEEPLAIASYNAGPAAVRRWAQRVEPTHLDRFLEEIPYAETRRYVIKVMRSLIRYRALTSTES